MMASVILHCGELAVSQVDHVAMFKAMIIVGMVGRNITSSG